MVVVGAGVIGFSTAVCIAESLSLCAVTLVADQFSPDTTSDGAAGIMFVSKYPGMSYGHVTSQKHCPKFFFSSVEFNN